MRFRGPLRKDLLASCNAIDPEDGVLPGKDGWKRSSRVANRKTLQLCSQVEHTLHLALATCGEACLRDRMVAAVEPAPDSTRLLVSLCPAPSAEPHEPAEVLAALQRAQAFLRREVASAIHRKKVPELTFRMID